MITGWSGSDLIVYCVGGQIVRTLLDFEEGRRVGGNKGKAQLDQYHRQFVNMNKCNDHFSVGWSYKISLNVLFLYTYI